MTVKELKELCGFEELNLSDPDREIDGVYIGDLLSWVMGRAKSDNVWITIMSNVNIVAVATLADPSCIILSEGVTLDGGVIEKAQSMGVNLLGSDKDTFSLCSDVASLL